MTAWRRIQRTAHKDVDIGVVVVFQLPQELPILLLDAKHFKIRKEAYTLYVGFDTQRSKPVCWILLPCHEIRDGYDRILQVFRTKKLCIEAVVSDNDQSIRASVADWYPSAVQQKCAFHVLKKAFGKLNGRRLIQTAYGRRLWDIIRKIVLGYDDVRKARAYFQKIQKKYPQYQKTWNVIERNLDTVYQFTLRSDLPIPRTSNQIENFMGVIEQRLKTFRSSKNANALIKIITAFIRIKYKIPTKR
jgi:transposase-like protein